MWGYENLGIEPDGFTIAKGLGGGHAIGALLVKEKANIFFSRGSCKHFWREPIRL
jgi:acetylornithine aminotransferase